MFSDLKAVWGYRHFWYALGKSDIAARYQKSLLGIGWSLAYPIAMTLLICLLFAEALQIHVSEFVPSLLMGLIFWTFFTAVVGSGAQCLRAGEPFIRQYSLPILVFPLRVVMGALFHFALAFPMVLLAQVYFGGLPNPAVLLVLPLVFILVLCLMVAVACLVSILNVLFSDTEHIAQIVLQFLFYATPIIYPVELMKSQKLYWMVQFNPVAACLELLRQPIIHGTLPSQRLVLSAVLGVAVVSAMAGLLVARYRRTIIFYL